MEDTGPMDELTPSDDYSVVKAIAHQLGGPLNQEIATMFAFLITNSIVSTLADEMTQGVIDWHIDETCEQILAEVDL